MSESLLPQVLSETLKRPSGLVLLVGNIHSDLNDTLSILENHFKKSKKDNYYKMQALDSVPSSALVVQMDKINNASALKQAIELCEEGRLVIAPLMSMSIVGALHKIYCDLDIENKKHWLWRFSDCIQLMMLQLTVAGIEQNEKVKAYEVILPSTQIRQLLVNEDIRGLENKLKLEEESTGLLSLNRSLFQNIIRRKIDLKTAFEISRDPEDLDQILKKAGV